MQAAYRTAGGIYTKRSIINDKLFIYFEVLLQLTSIHSGKFVNRKNKPVKKLFFTIFVVIFFSILFVAESIVKALLKLFGYFPGVSRLQENFGNNKPQGNYLHQRS